MNLLASSSEQRHEAHRAKRQTRRLGNAGDRDVVDQRHVEQSIIRVSRRAGIRVAMTEEDVAAAESEPSQAKLPHHQTVDAPSRLIGGDVDDDVAPSEADFADVVAAGLTGEQSDLGGGGRFSGETSVVRIAVVIRSSAVVDGVAASVGRRSG